VRGREFFGFPLTDRWFLYDSIYFGMVLSDILAISVPALGSLPSQVVGIDCPVLGILIKSSFSISSKLAS